MKDNLNLQQAETLLGYLKNSSGKETSNFEVLCGLVLCFCIQYLEMIVNELKKKNQ